MIRKKPKELSLQEIRFLVVEKRRAVRQVRLEHFYRTGRVMPRINEPDLLGSFRRWTVPRLPKADSHTGPQRTWVNYTLMGMECLAVIGIATDFDGTVWIVDTGNNRLAKFNVWK